MARGHTHGQARCKEWRKPSLLSDGHVRWAIHGPIAPEASRSFPHIEGEGRTAGARLEWAGACET